MMDKLDADSFEVESWTELLTFAIKTGQKAKFFKKLDDFIQVTNGLKQAERDRYTAKRLAQIRAQKVAELKKALKIEQEAPNEP